MADRTQWSDSLAEQVMPYQLIMDTLLEKDETYVDLMNRTFIYSAINRKNPVYISQSPAQLSGEYTQEQFIKQIKDHIDDIPIVVMPLDASGGIGLDGIANVYKYYKVSEFIWNHYRPLCSYGGFAVWCPSERYDEMKGKLSTLEAVTLIDQGYDGAVWSKDETGNSVLLYDGQLHNYRIDHLPRIWAESDEKRAENNEVVSELVEDSGRYVFQTGFEKRETGNYLLLTADHTDAGIENRYMDAIVKLGTYENGQFEEKNRYTITLKEGYHDYLIRISSDPYWYSEDISAVEVMCDMPLKDMEIKILEGD